MRTVTNIVAALLARLRAGRLTDLASGRHHPPYLTRHRLAAIVVRIRLVAAAFSLLTLFWIALDMLTLELRQWSVLAACRVVAVVAFAALALVPDREDWRRSWVLTMLAAMLAIPMALFAVAQFLLGGVPLHGLAAINGRLYEALPFIVLAGLSIFPLVTGEGLAFALPVVAAVAGVQWALAGLDVVRLASTLWVLALALGVYLLACAIQLHYMTALLRRASHDPLTGALTRRSGMEALDLHFRLACEQEAPFAVAFLDVDDFKAINDRHGHEAGDQALRDVAAALHRLLRQADMVIRWGGEEFVLVLANTDLEGVRLVMARILAEGLGRRPEGGPVTASIGVAERRADAVADGFQLIKIADERMYAAKTSGKARCVLADGVLLP